MLGRVVWDSGDEPPSPLLLVQRFLHNSTEGWALALTSLRDLYANAESVGGHPDPAERRALVDDQDAAFIAESARLGKVIAFNVEEGIGEVASDGGEVFGFHCTAIAGGERVISVGTAVVFSLRAYHRGELQATELVSVQA